MGNVQFAAASQMIREPGLEEEVLIRRATTWLTQAESTMERIREMERLIDKTRPEPATCRVCHADFKPAWNFFEGRWKFPDMAITPLKPGAMNGLCKTCRRLMPIRENIVRHLANAGIPPKYLNCSFDTFKVGVDARQYYKICQEYIIKPVGNIFLYGGYGTGKTHLAVAIAREILLQEKDLLFTSVPRLLFEIRKAFKQDAGDTEAFYVDKYSSCPFLILDDFGLEKNSEWARQTLDYIIYERDNHLRPTVVTSNLSLDELTEKMGGRTSSRLAGIGKVVLFKGEDFRLKRNR
jgi:DNA replication protein DnaC